MKVLFTASVYRHFTTFHIPYMKMFQSKGFEVYAAANSEDQIEKVELESLGIKCIDIPFSRNPLSLKNIIAYYKLKKLSKKFKFTLVHTHTPVASVLTRRVFKKIGGVKTIYTAHGFHFYKGASKINWLIYFNIEKIAAKWTDHLITINQEDFQNAKLLGYSENQVSYVHGVGIEPQVPKNDFNKEIALKKEFNIKDNDVIVSCVAELNFNKNQMFLLENWNEIKEKCPNAKLLLIGKGDQSDYYLNYTNTNHLEGVVFTGYRRDVLDILQISDIITLVSKREGLGKCLLEGMICKLPCIVTNTRGPRDLVTENVNGYLIELDDDKGLISKFVKLLNDKQLREDMGKESLKIVEYYHLEKVLIEYDEIYNKYIKGDL